jgi:hypothetical protein
VYLRSGYTLIQATNMTGRFSTGALNEFIAIYKEGFGEEIDRTEATEMAWRLLTLYRLLSKKVPTDRRASDSTSPQAS